MPPDHAPAGSRLLAARVVQFSDVKHFEDYYSLGPQAAMRCPPRQPTAFGLEAQTLSSKACA
jgi:hypothetical protein